MQTINATTEAPSILDLEHWRDQMGVRLGRLAREADPRVVEGFEYHDWRMASRARGVLTERLLDAIDQINAVIRVRLMGDVERTVFIDSALVGRDRHAATERVMTVVRGGGL
jgi:hypothetical protein